MATSSTYYIDTADFATATAVWIDSTLTTKAPDGYYSFTGNYRQQFEGLLLSIESCASAPTYYNFSMLNFGTDTSLEACADWVEGDPPNARIDRFSSNYALAVGDIIYEDSSLTIPFTWPVIQYYGYAQPIPSGGIFVKWCRVDTDGTVLEVDFC